MSKPNYYSDREALTNTVHMFQTVGVQVAAMKEVEAWAAAIDQILTGGKTKPAMADAAREVVRRACDAQTSGAAYREDIERLQHAIEAVTAESMKQS